MPMPEQYPADGLADEPLPEPKAALSHVATMAATASNSSLPVPSRAGAHQGE